MQKTKKILIIVTKGELGGVQVFVLNLARELIKNGVEVKIAFGEGDFLKEELKKEKISFITFKHLKRSGNPFENIFFIFELRNFLKNSNFDAVHFNSSNSLFGAISAKLLANKPRTIFTVHGLSVLDENYQANFFIKKIYYLFFKFFFLFIDKVIFVSQYNFEYARKINLISKGELIYNGLEQNSECLSKKESLEIFSKEYNCDIGSDDFIIGSIGRFAYPKNYEFLINIFPEIKKINSKAKLILIGDGEEKEKYKKLIIEKKLEKDVFLPGKIKNASRYLKLFDLFVLPSIYEGLSISLIEAFLADVPVLASSVGGNEEIVQNENCLYELNNEQDFLNKFNYILNNLENLKQSDNSKNKFYLEKMVEKYEKVYFS